MIHRCQLHPWPYTLKIPQALLQSHQAAPPFASHYSPAPVLFTTCILPPPSSGPSLGSRQPGSCGATMALSDWDRLHWRQTKRLSEQRPGLKKGCRTNWSCEILIYKRTGIQRKIKITTRIWNPYMIAEIEHAICEKKNVCHQILHHHGIHSIVGYIKYHHFCGVHDIWPLCRHAGRWAKMSSSESFFDPENRSN